MVDRGIAQRRAYRLIAVTRSALNYVSTLNVKDGPAIQAVKRLPGVCPRYGYRRVRIFLGREAHATSPSGAERLRRKAKLKLLAMRRMKRVSTSRPQPLPPRAAHHVGAYDLASDACANGPKLDSLSIVDEYMHYCLAIDVAGSIRSARIVALLEKLPSERGVPAFIRSDNGLELVSIGSTSAGRPCWPMRFASGSTVEPRPQRAWTRC